MNTALSFIALYIKNISFIHIMLATLIDIHCNYRFHSCHTVSLFQVCLSNTFHVGVVFYLHYNYLLHLFALKQAILDR